jgi:hypothetical protein
VTQPRILHTHLWDGGTVPHWLDLRHYHFDNGQLVIRHPDGNTPIHPGWAIALWSDGTCTVGSPTTAARVYGADGIHGRHTRAETALARIAAIAEEYPAGIDTALILEALDLPVQAAAQAAEHAYLSTGCFHGDHDYCQSMTGLNGSKRPGECKFCSAPCRCSCHAA